MAEQLPIGYLTLVNGHRRLVAEGMSSGTVSPLRCSTILTLLHSDVISIWPKQEIVLGCKQLQQYAIPDDFSSAVSLNNLLALSMIMIQPYPIAI
jgi:hypothetical protein